MDHSGGCHCGNIHVRLRLAKPPQETPLRACGCSFCRAHMTRTVADGAGHFTFSADDWSLVELYRFGSRTADYMVCRRCGVYIAAICETAAGTRAVSTSTASPTALLLRSSPTRPTTMARPRQRGCRGARQTGCRPRWNADVYGARVTDHIPLSGFLVQGQSMTPALNSAHQTITGCNASRGAWYHQLDQICGMSIWSRACLKLAGQTQIA
jgi:hypothetical protein